VQRVVEAGSVFEHGAGTRYVVVEECDAGRALEVSRDVGLMPCKKAAEGASDAAWRTSMASIGLSPKAEDIREADRAATPAS